MKNQKPFAVTLFIATMFFSVGLFAQEKTEVTISVVKDGKVIKDTTYQFDDEAKAKDALKMMQVLSGDDEHKVLYNYSMSHSGADHSTAVIYISEDGKKTEIRELEGDSLVWISEGDEDGEDVKVIRKKMIGVDDPDGEHVIVMKSGDVEKKVVKVMVSGDGEGTWHVDGKELEKVDEDEDIYIISGDNVKVELKEILEEHDGEDVKVIVVKKKSDEQ